MSSATSGAAPATAQTPPPPPQRTCFNTFCKEPTKADGRRRGWRLRSGDFAELCERCLCTYEQGNFCETFHNELTGWRSCEACGKRVHCGCIVSVHAYVLLDAGGVDCIACARKYFGTVPNQMWVPSPSSSSSMHHHHARLQSMRPPAPFPGQWRQTSSLWNISSAQSDLQQRLAFEFDRPSCSEKFLHQVRASNTVHQHHQGVGVADKKFDEMSERKPTGISGMNPVIRERFANGPGAPPGLDPAYPYSIYHHAEGSSSNSNPNSNPNPNPNQLTVTEPTGVDHVSVYNNRGEEASYGSSKDPIRFGPGLAGSPNAKGPGFFGPSQLEGSEMRSNGGRPRLDGRNRSQQVLPRYWPRITDQELQQINGDSNSVITPLFEKMLSASDAGRIGRLVLPKKCAEAYFPAIQFPEGLPLTVQDANGKNWTFQFRFWPNNNSRMYVLEGITPCIQAMQLQAGDTVTFSRIDPEGKLVMGFRKAAPVSGEPEIQHLKSGNGFLTSPPPNHNNTNTDNSNNTPKIDLKDSITNSQSESGGARSLYKESQPVGPTPLFPSRRKGNNNSLSGGKIKRLRIENEDSMELKVTWEEAQSLLRPPPNSAPSVTVIDGHEFEEYEEPPVLGRRTYFVTNHAGETHQWAQCCECMKWRKIPTDALLTAKWTCSENVWDSERSSCSSPAELTLEQLVELMPTRVGGGTKRKLKMETSDSATIEASDGLDTLANLAILEQSESAASPLFGSQQTTRHPRHRPGCSCIVCIQPPSGKGPKHKSSCVCNVCITVRRRFRTLMMRKERRLSEKELEEAVANHGSPPGVVVGEGGVKVVSGTLIGDFAPGPSCSDDVKNMMVPTTSSSSPLKAQIDLNIQPEKEEETSPKSVDELAATSAIKLLQDAPAPAPPSS